MGSQGDADMDSGITDEILEVLSSTLQRAEAQSAAILEFVKEKGIAKEDELATYLERANAASSVRWRATRVRLAHLLAGLEKRDQQAEEERKRKQESVVENASAAKQQSEEGREEKGGESKPDGDSGLKAKRPEDREQARKPEDPKTAEENEENKEQREPSGPVQSRRGDSAASRSLEQESRPGKQEQSKTEASNAGEKPKDKTGQRDAA
jgi:hypothetical protein